MRRAEIKTSNTQSEDRDIGLEGIGYVSITKCGPSGIEFCIECKVCILNAVIYHIMTCQMIYVQLYQIAPLHPEFCHYHQ